MRRLPVRLNTMQFRALVNRRYGPEARSGTAWWLIGGKRWSLVFLREDAYTPPE